MADQEKITPSWPQNPTPLGLMQADSKQSKLLSKIVLSRVKKPKQKTHTPRSIRHTKDKWSKVFSYY
jgi:hypothetical protein